MHRSGNDAVSEEGVSRASCVAPEYVWVMNFPDEALAVEVDGASEAQCDEYL